MFSWVLDHAATIITIAVILIAVGMAVFSLIRRKKNGSSCCTGNCAACGMGCSSGEENKRNTNGS